MRNKDPEKKKKLRLYLLTAVLIVASCIMLPYALNAGFGIVKEKIRELGADTREITTEASEQTERKTMTAPASKTDQEETGTEEGIYYTEVEDGLRQRFIAENHTERFANTVTDYVTGIYGRGCEIKEIRFLQTVSEDAQELICMMDVEIVKDDEEIFAYLEATYQKEFEFYTLYPAGMDAAGEAETTATTETVESNNGEEN